MLNVGKTFICKVLNQYNFIQEIDSPVKINGGWIVSFYEEPFILLFDEELNETARLAIDARKREHVFTHINANEDVSLISVSNKDSVRIFDKNEKELVHISHEAWRSFQGTECLFDRNGFLWTVIPDEKIENDHQLMILNPLTGETIAKSPIKIDGGYISFHENPVNSTVLIDVARGQYEGYLYRAELKDKDVEIFDNMIRDRVLYYGNSVFSPDGKLFVTAPHYYSEVQIHYTETGTVLKRVEEENIFRNDTIENDVIDYSVCYLSDHKIISLTRFGRLLVIDIQTMEIIGTIWPEGTIMTAFDIHGEETSEPADIIDYHTGISFFYPAERERLLVMDEDSLKLVDISNIILD